MRRAGITLAGEEATAALGRALAAHLSPGDTVLLSGPLGAGKTHLARAAIRALTHDGREVPSPSYTLVQDHGGIWHVDLYRLGDPSEVDELGLEEAFGSAIVLLEWPERLDAPPAGALTVHLTDGAPREAALAWTAPRWDAAVRDARIETFLASAGHSGAARAPLPGDWSARRYERLDGLDRKSVV